MKRPGRFAAGLHAWWLLAIALLLWAPASAQGTGVVKLAAFEGPVTPALAEYLGRAIRNAETSGAAALVIQLDTPGGYTDSTKQIMQEIASARVPVIVYVAPTGAHAGSAGTFLTLSGHLAAMAPGSSIGAASPIDSSGADLPDTLKAKETNILVADIKNLSARRGERAQAWAEKAVSEAAAATADEALALGVIDAVAPDVPSVLQQLDGRQVSVAGKEIVLHVAGAPIEDIPLSPLEAFLIALTNPALATILLTLGLNALLFELSSPGGYVAGVIGVVCLLLAVYGLGSLNANWVGLGFVMLAFALFLLDIKAPTHGVLTLGGIVTFILGAYLLFNTSDVAVPWLTILFLALATAGFFAFAIAKVVAVHLRPPVTGMEGLIGQIAHVRVALDPAGKVIVAGELWDAESDSGSIDIGEPVMVTGHRGYTLTVRKVDRPS